MGQPTCYSSVLACAIRVALLTETGAPVAGASNGYVSSALIKVDINLEIEEGVDFRQQNGCGVVCSSYKGDDKIIRGSLNMTLCHLDSQLISLMTGATVISSGGNVIGLQIPQYENQTSRYVSLEIWSRAQDNGEQATPAFTSGNGAYFHWVYPKTRWTLGQHTLEAGILQVPLTGIAEENSNITGDGPFNDWPPAVAAHDGITGVEGFWLDDDLPTAACNYIPVTSSAS